MNECALRGGSFPFELGIERDAAAETRPRSARFSVNTAHVSFSAIEAKRANRAPLQRTELTSSRLVCFLRVSEMVPLPKDMDDIIPDVEGFNLDGFGGSGDVARSGNGIGD